MAYTIQNAVDDLMQRATWLKRVITKQPLEGLVDGTNVLFRFTYAPVVSGSVTLYDIDGATISSGVYTLDLEAGTVTFDTAPSDTSYATYTAQAFTTTIMKEWARDGFAEMQGRYKRTLYLVTSSGVVYLSTDPDTPTEPTMGDIVFSENDQQMAFFNLCIRYAMYSALMETVSMGDHMYKESGRITGSMIDLRTRPDNMLKMLEVLDKRCDLAAETAADQAGEESGAGDWIPGARSDFYYDALDWHTNGMQDRGVKD